jgi:release factor glutamine methyltransferase
MTASCAQSLQWGRSYLQASGLETARLDAEVLLMHCLQWARTALYCHRDYQLSPDQEARFDALVRRRGAHEPIAYLIGEREFWSLPFVVRPGVLIPRPETEWVVDAALRYAPQLRSRHGRCHVLDLGTGSGNIAIALATSVPWIEVTAVDSSFEALSVARFNAQVCHVTERIRFICGDLLRPFHPYRGRAELLVSNPPYIAAEEWQALPATVRCYEPRQALDGGSDGLLFYRRLATEAAPSLVEGGIVIVEVGHRQADEVSYLLRQSQHWEVMEIIKDYSGIQRVVVARRRHKRSGTAWMASKSRVGCSSAAAYA